MGLGVVGLVGGAFLSGAEAMRGPEEPRRTRWPAIARGERKSRVRQAYERTVRAPLHSQAARAPAPAAAPGSLSPKVGADPRLEGALVNMGFHKMQAQAAIAKMSAAQKGAEFGEQVRSALAHLSK